MSRWNAKSQIAFRVMKTDQQLNWVLRIIVIADFMLLMKHVTCARPATPETPGQQRSFRLAVAQSSRQQ